MCVDLDAQERTVVAVLMRGPIAEVDLEVVTKVVTEWLVNLG
jgi:hypothetical protein